MGFPLLLNKALKWGQEDEYRLFTSCTLLKKGCSEWASGLSLDAEQSIGWSQKAWIGSLYRVDFGGTCSEWASGTSLAAKQSIGRSKEAWIGRFYKVDFVEEGHVQSGQVGFPLLLNNAWTWGQETWIWAFYKWHSFEEGVPEWASGLSLAAELSIEVGSRSMGMGFLQVAYF